MTVWPTASPDQAAVGEVVEVRVVRGQDLNRGLQLDLWPRGAVAALRCSTQRAVRGKPAH